MYILVLSTFTFSGQNSCFPPSSLTVKVRVGLPRDVRPGAEVDELHLGHALHHVNEDVLVLDVAVDDPTFVARHHRLQHLCEVEGRALEKRDPRAFRDSFAPESYPRSMMRVLIS